MHLSMLSALLFSLCVSAAACASEEVDAPPINDSISAQVGTPVVSSSVQCEGPTDELALLGSLCGANSNGMGWSRTTAAGAGMATIVGNAGGAQLIIANEVDRSPEHTENVAAEVSHAAFLVLESDPNPESSADALNQWHEGEAVTSGEVVVETLTFVACDTSWVASGVFVWRNTEISLSWQAASGC